MVIPNILAAHFLELFISSALLLYSKFWSCVFIALLWALIAPRTIVLPSKSITQTLPNSYHFRWPIELFQLNQLFEFIWLPLQFLTYLTDSEYQCPPSFTSFPILFISKSYYSNHSFINFFNSSAHYPFITFTWPLSVNPTIDQSCWASLQKMQQGRVLPWCVHVSILNRM